MREKWEEVVDLIAHQIANMMWGSATPERVNLVMGWLESNHIITNIKMLQGGKTQE